MAATLYRTSDVIASIQKAHKSFTHVLVSRSYASIRPAFFRSDRLHVEPIYIHAPWEPASHAQLERWRMSGGVLIDRNSTPDKAGPSDVVVLVEAPFSLVRVTRAAAVTREHVVIAMPHTWRVHEDAIDARTPPVETLQKIWAQCRGQRMTDLELAEATGMPKSQLQYMRAGLKPAKEWEMKPRLVPEAPGLTDAWKWLAARDAAGFSALRKTVRLSGHQAAIKEMARRGHITLTQYLVYSAEEPDWEKLAKRRAEALSNFAAARALVESLPEYLSR